MDKAKIKEFAIWAREKLIEDITYKAGMLGINEEGIKDALPQSTVDLKFYDIGTKNYVEVKGKNIKQREALVKAIKDKEKDCNSYKDAFKFIVEEVAYTWFNRLVAIRFMEVNNYLPSGVRVLSSENSTKTEPDIVTYPFDTDLEFSDEDADKVIELKDNNNFSELFHMLFIMQCNKLNEILPILFEKTDDYTEQLLAISYTDKEGVIYHLTHDIEEEDFDIERNGQVEIIGWLYQFYNSNPKDEVFANLKKKKKIKKEEIPAATQLFTPDWIVRYMVENSLGRLWIEGHPDNFLKENWKYYLEEEQQDELVEKQLREIRKDYEKISPEDIKIIDPCMGSGHVLVYTFDVLMQIYESMGYTSREATCNIVQNNIYGLDIDKRASQLAYFAIMMKARQYDRRFFNRKLQPNVFSIQESNKISSYTVEHFCNGDKEITNDIRCILNELKNAKEYGSILKISPVDFQTLYDRFDEIKKEISLNRESVLNELLPVVQVAEVMAQKYDVVVTNPPYMAQSGMNSTLVDYLKKNFDISKSDMFAIFIEVAIRYAKKNAFVSMITMQSWMFLASYVNIRERIIFNNNLINMVHLGAGAFEELNAFNVLTTMFTLRKTNAITDMYWGKYKRLNKIYTATGKEHNYDNKELDYLVQQKDFKKLPNYVIGYWISEKMKQILSSKNTMERVSPPRTGMMTSDNKKFLRLWHETDYNKIYFNCNDIEESEKSNMKWFPYIKGGNFRRWYGNREYIVNWQNSGRDIKANGMTSFRGKDFYFKEGITWSIFGFENFCARYSPIGSLFDIAGTSTFPDAENFYFILALLNTKIAYEILIFLNPSVNFQNGDIKKIPVEIPNQDILEKIDVITKENVKISKSDWDNNETSWEFKGHPMVIENKCKEIQQKYSFYKAECERKFQTLKLNEEELNKIFIDIYGLNDELNSYVEDKDITICRVFDSKEDIPESAGNSRYFITKQEVIKDFISYAVGCMFGRYSLEVDGLAYAGGEWNENKYISFIPDEDNCIPITDAEYFEDDIVGRFVEFVRVVYGKDYLEDNLSFVADALGNKGKTSREVIRNYFLNDFIKDHNKKYQKRPIYWMFDSGKQNGFKALVYMHRWNADTVGNVRVEYLHKMQHIYEREIERMQEVIDNSHDNKEINKAEKNKQKLQKQLKETKDYDAKIAHIALSRIAIDLDDGVIVNYEKVQTGQDGKNMNILAKIK